MNLSKIEQQITDKISNDKNALTVLAPMFTAVNWLDYANNAHLQVKTIADCLEDDKPYSRQTIINTIKNSGGYTEKTLNKVLSTLGVTKYGHKQRELTDTQFEIVFGEPRDNSGNRQNKWKWFYGRDVKSIFTNAAAVKIKKYSTYWKCYLAFVKAGADLLGLENDLAELSPQESMKLKEFLIETIHRTTGRQGLPIPEFQKVRKFIDKQTTCLLIYDTLPITVEGYFYTKLCRGNDDLIESMYDSIKQRAKRVTKKLHDLGYVEVCKQVDFYTGGYEACVWKKELLDRCRNSGWFSQLKNERYILQPLEDY